MPAAYQLSRFQSQDKDDWVRLWHGYMSRHDPSAVRPEVVQASWEAVVAGDGRIHAYALRDDQGQACGFIHYVSYFSTDAGRNEAYLMDFFVDPDHRGKGGGRMLIEHVIAECKSKGFSRLIWITVPGVEYNEKFYSKYAKRRSWDRYVVMTGET